MRRDIVRLDPFGIADRDALNPLDRLPADPAEFFKSCRELAAPLVARPPEGEPTGGTAAGKAASVRIPGLFTYRVSGVVIDPQGELMRRQASESDHPSHP